MKNAASYARKLKRLVGSLKNLYTPATPPADMLPLQVLLLSVLRANSSLEESLAALARFHEEFVDVNETRVAPIRDFVELLANMPDARDKGDRLTAALNFVYDHGNALDLGHMSEMGKRDQRSHLRDALKLDGFSEAYLMLYLFDSPSVPVDQRLLDRLKSDGMVPANAAAEEVRALLERIVPIQARREAFECLARYAADTSERKDKRRRAGKPGRQRAGGAEKGAGDAKKAGRGPAVKRKAAASSKNNTQAEAQDASKSTR